VASVVAVVLLKHLRLVTGRECGRAAEIGCASGAWEWRAGRRRARLAARSVPPLKTKGLLARMGPATDEHGGGDNATLASAE
jgi:hypothetical protein